MSEIPIWSALLLVLFLVLGSVFTFIGCLGLVFFSSFYERLHMPTLATSCGVGSIALTSVFVSFIDKEPTIHGILIVLFTFITTPVTMMMLSQAALQRDMAKDWNELSKNKDK